MGERMGRRAMKALLALSIAQAATGQTLAAPKSPKKKPQTSSWQAPKKEAPKKPETSSWHAEVGQERTDFGELLVRKEYMNPFRHELEMYQQTLRNTPQPSVLSDALFRNLLNHPKQCFFEMLNDESKELIRKTTDNRNVVLSAGINGREFQARRLGSLVGQEKAISESRYLGYGQSIPVRIGGKLRLAANAHEIAALDPRPEVRALAANLGGDDLVFYDITEAFLKERGINLATVPNLDTSPPQNFSLVGAPVFLRAFDPDAQFSQGPTHPNQPRIPSGFKEFFGIADRASWLQMIDTKGDPQRYTASHSFLLSSGEADPRHPVRGTRVPYGDSSAQMYSMGISGGPVDAYHEGQLYFVGLQFAARAQEVTDETEKKHDFSMALFYDRSRIVNAHKDPRRIFTIPKDTGLSMNQAKM